jgi:beta-1,2-mannobiose phosphorylase / 1,2-beta-oligomannan phosphorylase
LQPEQDYETSGYYKGVVFPCGNIVLDGKLFVYYGGADKYACLATCEMEELLDYLRTCPV